jgi:hypothetical protein
VGRRSSFARHLRVSHALSFILNRVEKYGYATNSRACVQIDNPPTSLRDWYTQNVLPNKCATKFATKRAQRFLEEV